MQHGKPEVGERHALVWVGGANQMPLVLHAAAGQQHGEVAIAVNRTIAHAAAENDERVIKNLGLSLIHI